jgi:hyperosmotically inducible periplasmic protein
MRKSFLLVALLAVALAAPVRAFAQVSDLELADAAVATVRKYAYFSIFDDVNINVDNRAVTITGRVTMPFKRNEIGSRIAGIDGVRTVKNDIQVLPVSMADSRLRMDVARAIYGNPAFWQYASMANPPIHIVVERGRVTLTGVVNNQVERMLAYSLAQVDGAMSVTNGLRLDKR